jgi:tetratricopeptide (TPR) repeat protein
MRRFAVLFFVVGLALPTLAEGQPLASGPSATTSIPANSEPPSVKRARKLDQLLGQLHKMSPHADVLGVEAQIWEIWSRNDSPTAEVLLRQSSAALSARAFEPAEKMLSQLLETYPTFAEGWNRRAQLYYFQQRYDAAMIDVDHALELEPRNYGALVGKAMIYRAMGEPDSAVSFFKQALEINPHLLAVKDAITQIEKDSPKI